MDKMVRLAMRVAATGALTAVLMAGCAASGDGGSASAGSASGASASASATQSASAALQEDSSASASHSASSASTSDAVTAASSDAVTGGSSDAAVGRGSSDAAAGRGSSDAATGGSSDAATGGSSDAASSDSRSSEPVLDGPSGLVENDVTMQYVSMKEALSDIESGDKTKLFVDLRKPEDYKAGHIKGAVNAPLNKVVDNNNYADGIANLTATLSQVTGNEVGEGRDVVLVCYAGKKYAQAGTDILNALGADMTTVYTLEGGMTAWNEAGNPVVK